MTKEDTKAYNTKYRLAHKQETKEYLLKRKAQIKKWGSEYYLLHKEERKEYQTKHKEIIKEKSRKYRLEHLNKLKARDVKYYSEHRERIKGRSAKYRISHKEEIKEYKAKYNIKNREKVKVKRAKYCRERKHVDPLFKMVCNLRSRTNKAFDRIRLNKSARTEELVGADYRTVMFYIESKFIFGMSWENYGEWHIDHKKPLALAKTEKQLIKLFNYKNLQPLWAEENISKGIKLNFTLSTLKGEKKHEN